MFDRIMWLGRSYRHAVRYRQIAAVLVRHGLEDLAERVGLGRHLPRGKKSEAKPHQHATGWARLRVILEELGPSFIKLGQMASTRPDLIPPPACEELSKLQEEVPPFGPKEVRQMIRDELGEPIVKIFRSFHIKPIASASIAQVHKAVTLDGHEVAVKIQRPGIRRTVIADLEIMFTLARHFEAHSDEVEALQPVQLTDEFSRTIKKELDFENEASNIERFARNFRDDETVHVPQVYRDLTTSKVLTMEYVTGTKVSDVRALRESGADPETVAKRGADYITKQIFQHGFFHSDPHAGNILVMPGNVICMLDYGQTGSLSQRNREALGAFTVGMARRNVGQMARALAQTANASTDPDSLSTLEADLEHFTEQYLHRPLEEIRMDKVIHEVISTLIRRRLRLPPVFYLLGKALAEAEGNGRRLWPQFNLISHLQPFIRRMLRQRYDPRRISEEVATTLADWRRLLRNMPIEISEILARTRQGRLRVQFDHRGLEPMLRTHDRISNRVVFGLVLSALIIGSALVVLAGVPPMWNNVPIIGIVGFVVAGLMGFVLLISIIHGSKM